MVALHSTIKSKLDEYYAIAKEGGKKGQRIMMMWLIRDFVLFLLLVALWRSVFIFRSRKQTERKIGFSFILNYF